MLPQETIRMKRNGHLLSSEDIAAFVRGITADAVSDGQIGAFGMAVYFAGMSREEAVSLTLAMRDSGKILNWNDLPGPVSDKHSTGGVGDNVSLMLAPIAAACGVFVPMISGRGLGHTGGTLDKMDAIPGYCSRPDTALFRDVVRRAGCAIIGQTADLAPADRRFYAVRDVTATVESVPLITASILSKKLAAGLQSLVLDVKFGNGAFMQGIDQARALAVNLVEVANGAGLPTTALLTDMDQPLSPGVGNAIETAVAIDFLTGRSRPRRLAEVVLALTAELLIAARVAIDHDDALARAQRALDSGRGAEIFGRMAALLGGPVDLVERATGHLPTAPLQIPVFSDRAGFVGRIATREVGMAVVGLGGGRVRPTDTLDLAVGITAILPIGTPVCVGDPLAFVHARDRATGEATAATLRDAIGIDDELAQASYPIAERIH